MGKATNMEIAPEDEAKLRADIGYFSREIGRLLKRMERRQGEIDKLRESTRATLAKLRAERR